MFRKNPQVIESPEGGRNEKSLMVQVQNLTLENEQYSIEYDKLKKLYLKLCHANSDTLRELEKERADRKVWEAKTNSTLRETHHVHYKLSNLSGRLREMVSECRRTMKSQHCIIRQKIIENLSSPMKRFPPKNKVRRVIEIKRKKKKVRGQQENRRQDSLVKMSGMVRRKKKKKKIMQKKKKMIHSTVKSKAQKIPSSRIPFTNRVRFPVSDRESRMMKDLDLIISSFHELREVLKKQKSFLSNVVSSQIVRAGHTYQSSLKTIDELRTELMFMKSKQFELEKNVNVYRNSFKMENSHKKDYETRVLPQYEIKIRELEHEKMYWDERFEKMDERTEKLEIKNFVQTCLSNVTQHYERRNFSHYQNTSNLQRYIHHFESIEDEHRQLTCLHAEEKRLREGRVTHLNNENRLLKLELRKSRTLVKKFQEELKYLNIRLEEEKKKVKSLNSSSSHRRKGRTGQTRFHMGGAQDVGVKRDRNMRKNSLRGVKREIFKGNYTRGSYPVNRSARSSRRDRK